MSSIRVLSVVVFIVVVLITTWYIVKHLPKRDSDSGSESDHDPDSHTKNCCEIYDKIYSLRSVNDDNSAGTVACYPTDKTELSDLGKWAFGTDFNKNKCPVNKEKCHWSRNYSGCTQPPPPPNPPKPPPNPPKPQTVYDCKDPNATNYNPNPNVVSRNSMCVYPAPKPTPKPIPKPTPKPTPSKINTATKIPDNNGRVDYKGKTPSDPFGHKGIVQDFQIFKDIDTNDTVSNNVTSQFLEPASSSDINKKLLIMLDVDYTIVGFGYPLNCSSFDSSGKCNASKGDLYASKQENMGGYLSNNYGSSGPIGWGGLARAIVPNDDSLETQKLLGSNSIFSKNHPLCKNFDVYYGIDSDGTTLSTNKWVQDAFKNVFTASDVNPNVKYISDTSGNFKEQLVNYLENNKGSLDLNGNDPGPGSPIVAGWVSKLDKAKKAQMIFNWYFDQLKYPFDYVIFFDDSKNHDGTNNLLYNVKNGSYNTQVKVTKDKIFLVYPYVTAGSNKESKGIDYPCSDPGELSGQGFSEGNKAYCRILPHQNFNTRGMNASDLRGCIGGDLHSTWYYRKSRAHINPDRETATIDEASQGSPGHTLTVPARDDNFSTSIDCIYDETDCRNDVKAALKAGAERTQQMFNSKPLFQAYHWGGYGSVPMSHLHTVTSEYRLKGNDLSGTSPLVDYIPCEGNHNNPSTLRNKVSSHGVCVYLDIESDGTYNNLDSNAEFICKNRYDPMKN